MATTPKFTTGSVDYVKDVRRNKANRDWDAYILINGEEQYLGSRDRSWDAEQLCDAYVNEQLTIQARSIPVPEVVVQSETTADEPGEPITETSYVCGEAELWVDNCGCVTVFVADTDIAYWHAKSMCGRGKLRDLAKLLSHPDVVALLAAA